MERNLFNNRPSNSHLGFASSLGSASFSREDEQKRKVLNSREVAARLAQRSIANEAAGFAQSAQLAEFGGNTSFGARRRVGGSRLERLHNRAIRTATKRNDPLTAFKLAAEGEKMGLNSGGITRAGAVDRFNQQQTQRRGLGLAMQEEQRQQLDDIKQAQLNLMKQQEETMRLSNAKTAISMGADPSSFGFGPSVTSSLPSGTSSATPSRSGTVSRQSALLGLNKVAPTERVKDSEGNWVEAGTPEFDEAIGRVDSSDEAFEAMLNRLKSGGAGEKDEDIEMQKRVDQLMSQFKFSQAIQDEDRKNREAMFAKDRSFYDAQAAFSEEMEKLKQSL